MDRFHEVHFIERKIIQKMYVVWESDLQKIKQLPDLIICGLKFGLAGQNAAQKNEKNEWSD